jgi:TatD DNase family protein
MVLECLNEHPKSGIPILHWFLATKKQISKAIDLGCYFSIGPAMLISARARKVISWLPDERILLETDGPFAKVDRNILFPSNVQSVIEYLSNDRGRSREEVLAKLSNNLKNLVSN